MHEVLVNRLGGLSLPRKSVVRLTDRLDMTLDVYRGHKTTIRQNNKVRCAERLWLFQVLAVLFALTIVYLWTVPLRYVGRVIFLFSFFLFSMKNLVAISVDPHQRPDHVASDLGLHCLPMTFYRFPGKNGLSKSTCAKKN